MSRTTTKAGHMTLTRDQIFAIDDLPTETVEVPEWGGSVIVRGLTAAETDDYELSSVVERAKGSKDAVISLANLRARLVVRAVVNEAGERLFSDDDAERLGRMSGLAVGRIFPTAQRLSGLSRKAMEEIAGNSGGESGFASPSS
jgi:hypothetical protein